jgi:hypothetical protein
MNHNPPKYSSFLIVSMKDIWVIMNPGLSVGETMAPGVRHSSTLQYLGIKYTFSEDVWSGALIHKLAKAINSSSLSRKPLQKVQFHC